MKSKDLVKSTEHEVLRALREVFVQVPTGQPTERSAFGRKMLVALSGGVDSVVLLHILKKWQSLLKYELTVAYVHHGRASTSKQMAYRNQAQKFAAQLAKKYQLPFLTNLVGVTARNSNGIQGNKLLKSEKDLRDFRWKHLREWAAEDDQTQLIATAHHRDDLIETQLMRLIRGTSAEGLQAMTVCDRDVLRPLLNLSKRQILAYVRANKLKFIADPSNKKTSDSLRNWLRKTWLPQLEKRSKGASKSLARSLQLIAETSQVSSGNDDYLDNGGVQRKRLKAMTKKQQQGVLVEYLRRLEQNDFQQSHINEVLRRLDTRRKNSSFQMLGLNWTVSPDLIIASRV